MGLDQADLTDLSLFVDERHHEVLAELRRSDPVHWQETADGRGFWCLTRHADVVAASRDTDTFASARGFTLNDFSPPEGPAASRTGIILALDAPDHTRQRRIVNRGFTPRAIGRLEAHLAGRARHLVDRVIDAGACDIVTDIAAELPLQAIADLIGVPAADRERILRWGNQLIGLDDPEYASDDPEARLTAIAEMFAYAADLRARRREEPRDDLVTRLTTAEVDGEELSEREFGEFFLLLAVAGNETSRNAVAHGVRALARRPDQLAALRADLSPPRLGRAVEEVLRWASPVMYLRRTATRDVELGGRTIRRGDRVVMWFVSANRDEAVFDDPFRFDIDRHPNEHVAFGGGGPHFCLGANLARMEVRLLLAEIVGRLPGLALDGPVEVLRSNFVAGIKHLPVRWDPPAGTGGPAQHRVATPAGRGTVPERA